MSREKQKPLLQSLADQCQSGARFMVQPLAVYDATSK